MDRSKRCVMEGLAGTIRRVEYGIQPLCKVAKRGLFQRILNDLGLDADLQDMSLDSTCVKAHQHSAGAKKGL
jgi:hypothetical protein